MSFYDYPVPDEQHFYPFVVSQGQKKQDIFFYRIKIFSFT